MSDQQVVTEKMAKDYFLLNVIKNNRVDMGKDNYFDTVPFYTCYEYDCCIKLSELGLVSIGYHLETATTVNFYYTPKGIEEYQALRLFINL